MPAHELVEFLAQTSAFIADVNPGRPIIRGLRMIVGDDSDVFASSLVNFLQTLGR